MKPLNKRLAAILIAAYLAAGALLVLGLVPHHAGGGCGSLLLETVVCPLTVDEHLSAWQDLLAAAVPILLLLLAVAFASVQVVFAAAVLVTGGRCRQGLHRPPVIPLFQRLFSDGILHPKIP